MWALFQEGMCCWWCERKRAEQGSLPPELLRHTLRAHGWHALINETYTTNDLSGSRGKYEQWWLFSIRTKKKQKTCLLVFLKQLHLPNPMWIRAKNSRKTKQTTSSQTCCHFIWCWLKRLNNSADANWFLVRPSPSHRHPSLILCNQADFGPVEAEWCLVP